MQIIIPHWSSIDRPVCYNFLDDFKEGEDYFLTLKNVYNHVKVRRDMFDSGRHIIIHHTC